jgi:hypothetical protein
MQNEVFSLYSITIQNMIFEDDCDVVLEEITFHQS